MEEVEYLGHIVGCDGLRIDPKEIQEMQLAPTKNLQEFVGILGSHGLLSQVCLQLWMHCYTPTNLLKKKSFL